jgi:hypothetical protein
MNIQTPYIEGRRFDPRINRQMCDQLLRGLLFSGDAGSWQVEGDMYYRDIQLDRIVGSFENSIGKLAILESMATLTNGILREPRANGGVGITSDPVFEEIKLTEEMKASETLSSHHGRNRNYMMRVSIPRAEHEKIESFLQDATASKLGGSIALADGGAAAVPKR